MDPVDHVFLLPVSSCCPFRIAQPESSPSYLNVSSIEKDSSLHEHHNYGEAIGLLNTSLVAS